MSEQPNLGAAIAKATRFLRTIHRDAQSLLDTLDEMMGAQGWMPTERGRISNELGNAIHDIWVIGGCYRIFVPKGRTEGSERVVGFYICFDPPECWEYAICLAVAVRLTKPASFKGIWDGWEQEGENHVLQWLSGQKDSRKVPEIPVNLLTDRFFPTASRGFGLVVPLDTMTDPQSVRSKLVEPVIGAEGQMDRK